MKTVTRALALVLALTLLLAMSATVFAADDTYTITISGDNVVAGHIYEAYQIFKGDLAEKDSKTILSNIEWGSSVNGDALLTALKADATLGNDFKDCTTAAQVADVLATYGSDAGKRSSLPSWLVQTSTLLLLELLLGMSLARITASLLWPPATTSSRTRMIPRRVLTPIPATSFRSSIMSP